MDKKPQHVPNTWTIEIEEVLFGEGFSEAAIRRMKNAYKEKHRFYHNCDHLRDLVNKINSTDLDVEDKGLLLIAAGYHDIVYNPQSKTNEQDSLAIFLKDVEESRYFNAETAGIEQVSKIIMATASREMPEDKLSQIFWMMDNDILLAPFSKLIDYELKIYKEFQFADYPTYKRERCKFLLNEAARTGNEHLKILADFVQGRRPSVGIYPGSFNPFHKGHLNILEKAERMFDKVIIVKGNNPDKKKEDKLDRILRTPKAILNREIIEWDGLTTELMKNLAAHSEVTLIRGLRDGKDLDYEINQLRFMEDMYKELNVCFVHCDKEYEHISSSAIRKIDQFSREEAKKYLP